MKIKLKKMSNTSDIYANIRLIFPIFSNNPAISIAPEYDKPLTLRV